MRSVRCKLLAITLFAVVVGQPWAHAQTAPPGASGAAEPQASATSSQPAPPQPKEESKQASRPLPPWQMLTAGATDHNIARRAEAIAALGTMGPNRRAVRLVESALADKDPSIRQLAAKNLGEMNARGSIPKLKEALNDESAEVSFAAAKSLGEMGDRSGRDVFIDILSGGRSSSTGMVKGEVQTAKKKLQDPRELAVIGAKEAASSLFGPAGWGIKIMEEVTKDRSASARAMSAALLGRDATADALRGLDDALTDKNWIVRVAAAQALGATRQRDQIASLEPLLEDQRPAVRYRAAASILRLSREPVVAAPVPGSPSKVPAPAPAPQPPTTSRKDPP